MTLTKKSTKVQKVINTLLKADAVELIRGPFSDVFAVKGNGIKITDSGIEFAVEDDGDNISFELSNESLKTATFERNNIFINDGLFALNLYKFKPYIILNKI